VGFSSRRKATTGLDKKVEKTAVEAARRKFSPEFMNRLDKVVVFHPLRWDELMKCLRFELGQVQKRVSDSTARPSYSNNGTRTAVPAAGGTDQRYGARHLKARYRALSGLPHCEVLATAQVHQGDAVSSTGIPVKEGCFPERHGKAFFLSKMPFAISNRGSCDCGSLK